MYLKTTHDRIYPNVSCPYVPETVVTLPPDDNGLPDNDEPVWFDEIPSPQPSPPPVFGPPPPPAPHDESALRVYKALVGIGLPNKRSQMVLDLMHDSEVDISKVITPHMQHILYKYAYSRE